jgi:putative phosphoribosyl transferase
MIVSEEHPFFRDRDDAGDQLAEALKHYGSEETAVIAIPRGGVPVAAKVADELGAGLDVVVTRKIGIPGNPEAGYGAVTEDGVVVLNEPLVDRLGLTQAQIEGQAGEVRAEIARRAAVFRSRLRSTPIEGKTAIVIDDGLASGFTMMAAIESVQRRRAARIVAAVPVASGSAYDVVKPVADELVALVVARTHWFAVASFYQHWHDLTDGEVIRCLDWWVKRRRAVE